MRNYAHKILLFKCKSESQKFSCAKSFYVGTYSQMSFLTKIKSTQYFH